MEYNSEDEGKIDELQAIEQTINSFLIQKQTFQVEMSEIENAVREVNNAKDGEVFRITSGIMVKKNKNELIKELEEKKQSLSLKINAIEKQEEILKKKSLSLRQSLSSALEKSKNNQ